MAAPVANFTAVTTGDAAPTTAPHRISRQATKNELDFTWQVTFDGKLRYWQERLGGSLRTNGTQRRHLGVVCGLGNRCGAQGSRALGATTTIEESDTVTDSELATEGDYRFGVDALDASGLWSSTS